MSSFLALDKEMFRRWDRIACHLRHLDALVGCTIIDGVAVKRNTTIGYRVRKRLEKGIIFFYIKFFFLFLSIKTSSLWPYAISVGCQFLVNVPNKSLLPS